MGLGVAWLGGKIAQQAGAIKQDYPSYKDWAGPPRPPLWTRLWARAGDPDESGRRHQQPTG